MTNNELIKMAQTSPYHMGKLIAKSSFVKQAEMPTLKDYLHGRVDLPDEFVAYRPWEQQLRSANDYPFGDVDWAASGIPTPTSKQLDDAREILDRYRSGGYPYSKRIGPRVSTSGLTPESLAKARGPAYPYVNPGDRRFSRFQRTFSQDWRDAGLTAPAEVRKRLLSGGK